MVNTTVAPPEPKTPKRKAARQRALVPLDSAEPWPVLAVNGVAHRHELFSDALLDQSATRPRARALDFFLSLFVHTLLISILILLPLYYTEAIDLRAFQRTMLVAPPPPPPPPPPAAAMVARPTPVRRMMSSAGRLVAPTAIPREVAMLKEDPLPADVPTVGVVGGVPGGVPGGQVGGVIGGIISGAPRAHIPPPPVVAAPKAPIRVGGRIKAPEVIFQPDPFYPPLARQARIQGEVRIDAVIDTGGNVVGMQVISGHPLLISAATETLARWKYRPTYLNDEPVSVRLVVTMNFRLR